MTSDKCAAIECFLPDGGYDFGQLGIYETNAVAEGFGSDGLQAVAKDSCGEAYAVAEG